MEKNEKKKIGGRKKTRNKNYGIEKIRRMRKEYRRRGKRKKMPWLNRLKEKNTRVGVREKEEDELWVRGRRRIN